MREYDDLNSQLLKHSSSIRRKFPNHRKKCASLFATEKFILPFLPSNITFNPYVLLPLVPLAIAITFPFAYVRFLG
jgi:hypothetical protein